MQSRHKLLILSALSLALVALLTLPAVDAEASFTAGLTCEPDFGGAFCEASPQNPNYDYGWTATGAAYFPSPCGGSYICHVSCTNFDGSGTVTVTVTKPNGVSDSATRSIRCPGTV